ncbi:16S rRNA (guanine(966)-N(2))-methyltransferase RsmD [Roseomonas xinghualingensis]|uniref:16S rRNA (guanine(966)-N(2))-methyltransferase RsmD n=1 Tax=Roseomonas xinghualingensis TaxID=2986475 RepID=UPI0021F21ABE|nr:16S rRNA (guanine(966)-N(2))-methyltransferase RsmD [Roseomonas sp. SXEYE001]MCV4206511.1 16S rRNA (guanine(966)-N(2))-methyltransferase RsmD [Roseomonas sp. SXEYE001]
MRIVAGRWRGRALQAPPGTGTRPTSDRVRQGLFDALWHAPWAGRQAIEGTVVLDAFAGTGALGLEALSRGAARAVFMERDRAALAALRANVAAVKAEGVAQVLAADVLRPPRAETGCGLVFLDPPYGKDLGPAALAGLRAAGWIAPGALACLEIGREEEVPPLPGWDVVAEREQGAARMLVLRDGSQGKGE